MGHAGRVGDDALVALHVAHLVGDLLGSGDRPYRRGLIDLDHLAAFDPPSFGVIL
jgi:hypothetical protein